MAERIEMKRGGLAVRVVPGSVSRFTELGWVEAPKAEPKSAPKRASRSRTKQGDGEE